MLQGKVITQDFMVNTLFQRLVGLFKFKDYHDALIDLLISMNDIMMIPPNELFLLFEPVVICSTLTKFRSLYPLASKSAALQAFEGVKIEINGADETTTKKPNVMMCKYTSPYNDIALEPKMKEKDRDKYCPKFDNELNDRTSNK